MDDISQFIYWTMRSLKYRQEILAGITGTTVKHTSPSKILEYKVPFCNDVSILKKFEIICNKIQNNINLLINERIILIRFKNLLLLKMSSYENNV